MPSVTLVLGRVVAVLAACNPDAGSSERPAAEPLEGAQICVSIPTAASIRTTKAMSGKKHGDCTPIAGFGRFDVQQNQLGVAGVGAAPTEAHSTCKGRPAAIAVVRRHIRQPDAAA